MSNVTSSARKLPFLRISTAMLGIAALAGLTSTTQGSTYSLVTSMTGLQENPPNASPGTGFLNGTYDDVTNTLDFNVNFSGLTAGTTAAHFHGPAPIGTNAPVVIGWTGFPTGVTSGTYSNTFVLTGAQESDLLNNLYYTNIHTSTFPGGEIRSQVLPLVPEPTVLSVLGLAGLAALTRRPR